MLIRIIMLPAMNTFGVKKGNITTLAFNIKERRR